MKNKVIVLMGCLVIVGCRPSQPKHINPPIINVVAIDRSGSTQNMRETQILALRSAFARAADWGEEVAIYMVDREITCLLQAKKIRDDARIEKQVLVRLKEIDSFRSNGTRPYNFWKEVEKKYMQKEKKVRILYLTDGDNDWKDDDRYIDKTLLSISKNLGVNIAILGINKDSEDRIKNQFSCFGDRFSYSVGSNISDIVSGITKWREKK